MSALTDEIKRMQMERMQNLYTGIGGAILSTPLQGVTQDNWKDALLANVLKNFIGGGLAGYGIESGRQEADALTREALALQVGIRSGDIKPESLASGSYEYSPELSGVVGQLVEESATRSAEEDALMQALMMKENMQQRKEQRSIANALLKEQALQEAGLGQYSEAARSPKTVVNLGRTEALSDKMAEKALTKLVDTSTKLVPVENEVIGLVERFNELKQKFPSEDLSNPSGWSNSLKRQFSAIFGDKDANAIAQTVQGGLNRIVEMAAGTQTEGDIGRKVLELKGKSAIESLDIMSTEFDRWKNDILTARQAREGLARDILSGQTSPDLIARIVTGGAVAPRTEVAKTAALGGDDLTPEEQEYLKMGYSRDEIIATR